MTDGEMKGGPMDDLPSDPMEKALSAARSLVEVADGVVAEAADSAPARAPRRADKPADKPATKIERWEADWPTIVIEISGGASLKSCCEKRGIKPPNVHRWLIRPDNKARMDEYNQAYTIQADIRADEVDEMAKYLEANGKDMKAAEVQAYRVAIDTKKWSASVRNRRKYAERNTIEVDTPDQPQDALAELNRLKRELGGMLTLVKTDKPKDPEAA